MTNQTNMVNPSQESIDAFTGVPDNGPIVMVNLLKFREPDGRERYRRYASVSSGEIAERGGRVIYSGASLAPAADWDSVALVYYPRRKSWLDMQNSPAYQAAIDDRTAGLERRLLYSFRPSDQPSTPLNDIEKTSDTEIAVVNLVKFRGDSGRDEYRKYGETAGSMIRDLGGRVLLHLTGDFPLVADDEWAQFILVRYPSIDALQGMVASPRWKEADRDHRQAGLAGTIAFPTRQR